ncbi:MAG: HipA N-terminal domain-containing protein [Duncaniella sp.]|nr:HipA N-terminal domain-containing protein [Duncaniella sp.]
MKKANIYVNNTLAGVLAEDDMGYEFRYLTEYLNSPAPMAVSLTLPLTEKPYREKVLFPFFDGLIPEGWLLEIAEESWKISSRDRFSLLLACCKDCIGNISVVPADGKEMRDE